MVAIPSKLSVLVNSFMNGTQSWFPMEWMKWAICHLEQLQASFGHPFPIRNALHLIAVFTVHLFLRYVEYLVSPIIPSSQWFNLSIFQRYHFNGLI